MAKITEGFSGREISKLLLTVQAHAFVADAVATRGGKGPSPSSSPGGETLLPVVSADMMVGLVRDMAVQHTRVRRLRQDREAEEKAVRKSKKLSSNHSYSS